MNHRRRGIRLTRREQAEVEEGLPFLGYIAAGHPIEAVEQQERMPVPEWLRSGDDCYLLQVRGDSMIDEGILDGDHIVVEPRNHARNGEIVVALVDGSEATLKRIEQRPGAVLLHPANPSMAPMRYPPERVQIQGVLVGQMRRYP
ncbi:MAG TPA: repressor LexA, partial [Sedimenticola sp.]|nr:repressor LexA [Sedimenticola sp.]